MEALRRSGRFRGQRPMVEKNTVDKAINAREEDSDDDFVPVLIQANKFCGGRKSNRLRGKQPVVEENTIDEAINVHEEDSDDDFEPVRYPMKQASGSNATPVKWTKRMIISRSHDSADVMKESEITKGKKRASTDNKMIRNKKKKGETANVATKDTSADTEAGPSKVDGIPSRLGFYVVDKFDIVAMEIKLKKDSLVVNKEVISEMLGLRNKGINILMNEVSGNEEMIQEWKDQFDVPEKDITPSIIKSKIRRSTVV
ncbi:hypothetical protein Tco_1222055, partial [Tanacetum coccineum]